MKIESKRMILFAIGAASLVGAVISVKKAKSEAKEVIKKAEENLAVNEELYEAGAIDKEEHDKNIKVINKYKTVRPILAYDNVIILSLLGVVGITPSIEHALRGLKLSNFMFDALKCYGEENIEKGETISMKEVFDHILNEATLTNN